jgi:hypothetical protein
MESEPIILDSAYRHGVIAIAHAMRPARTKYPR